MKFSRSLVFASASDAKGQYLKYDTLKKLVSEIGAVTAHENNDRSDDLVKVEGEFERLFRDELAKISTYYQERQRILLAEAEADEARALEESYCALQELLQCLQMNLMGFYKVLKSHDKYSKAPILSKLSPLTDAALPSSDVDIICNKISSVEQKYASIACSHDMDGAKTKLAAINQERQSQARAAIWQEMVRRDRHFTASVGDADESHPEKSSRATTANVAAHHHKTNPYRVWQLLLLVIIFLGIVIFPMLSDRAMNNTMAMCILAIGLWITEAIPLYATALLIPILLVLLRIFKDEKTGLPLVAKEASKFVASRMFSKVPLTLLGGFAIAAATSNYGVAKHLAVYLLRLAGTSTGRLVAIIIILAQAISMFISNVTAPVLCFTLLTPLLRAIPPESPLGKQLVLAVAVAANLGGAISPISSPQNVVALGILKNVGWVQWLTICVPFCAVAGLGCWFVIMGRNLNKSFNSASYFSTGNFSWGPKELTVVITILITIAMWAFDPIGVDIFGDGGIISLVPVIVFFGVGLLSKEDFNSFPWNVIMLAIGGLLMGDAVEKSGLLGAIAGSLKMFSTYSLFMQLALITLIATIATCFISHTVGAIIFLPIVKAVSNDSPLVIMGATLACSAGMALPISSFPNMAASGQENSLGRPWLSSSEFVKYGMICSLIAWVTVCSVGYTLMNLVNL